MSIPMLTVAAVALAGASTADIEADTDEIVVQGRALGLLGEADSASEGVIAEADFDHRPLSRLGELFETIPGLAATQHSGEGKGNQLFLRGFNLDHGTDLAIGVEGMPVNLRTHGHGQGYLDFGFIIPELVESIAFEKGPYGIEGGDFSLAARSEVSLVGTLDRPFVELGVGENGFLRGVGAGSVRIGPGDLLVGLEAQAYDGPWVLEQDLRRLNAIVRYGVKTDRYDFDLTLSAYDAEWTATDQVPARAIESGLIDRLGFIDPDLGGETSRYSAMASAAARHRGGARTMVSAFASAYDLQLFSNFTYRLDDPVLGDEFEQLDQRVLAGGALRHERPFGRATLTVGAEARHDEIGDVGLFGSAGRVRTDTVRRDEVSQTSGAVYAEGALPLTDRLRARAGVRLDAMRAEVTSLSDPRNTGEADDAIVTPVASIAYRATDRLELYGSYGEGFHSNDARGATIAFDPATGDAVAPIPLLVEGQGAEVGARLEAGPVTATLAAFALDLDSELVFVGDAGTTEPNGATRRVGIEGMTFWRPAPWLAVDASASYTRARFRDEDDDRIPNSLAVVASVGVLVERGPWAASVRIRHLGESPLDEANSVTAEPVTLANALVGYNVDDWSLSLEALNLTDAEEADITYFFESRLPEETEPAADRHLHPVEPRQLRLRLRRRF